MNIRLPLPARRGRKVIVVVCGVVLALVPIMVYDELAGRSTLQAHYFTRLARGAGFHLAPGPGVAPLFPATGPFDERLGYTALPRFLERLAAQDCTIVEQAQWTPRLSGVVNWGLNPPYREITRTGLTLRDREGATIHVARYPQRGYQRFEDIPPLVVASLLFIENRELFDDEHPKRNPAIELNRLARAVLERTAHLVVPGQRTAGGSTLATQMEKYRHSPEGRTETVAEKLRQILSASLRSYQSGEDTRTRRQEIVLDYLNTVPLGGRASHGEVHGLGDALAVWYGRELEETNRLLNAPSDTTLVAKAAAYKAVLSLLVAQRRPSTLLNGDIDRLERMTERYLVLLAEAGIIAPELRDAARAVRLAFAPHPPVEAMAYPAGVPPTRKGVDALRNHLAAMLGVQRRYDLDRLHLEVDTTLDTEAQAAVGAALRAFANPTRARQAGLMGEQLLARGDPAKVVYSVTLYELRDGAPRLLVQTDNVDQPFDVNDGLKLDLGSTAKLRTLVTYLELMATLHARHAGRDAAALRALAVDPGDALERWVVDYLLRAPDRSLAALLEAALERRYSASAAEEFFTGGGLHRFHNFRAEDDYRVLSVRQAFRESVNLVFVRLMRDIVRHHAYAAGTASLLNDPDDPRRAAYLARFIAQDSRVFIERYYRKYRGLAPDAIEALLMRHQPRSAVRAASVFHSIAPNAGMDEFTAFLTRWSAPAINAPAKIERLRAEHAPHRLSLADRAYLAGVHPLELAVAAVMRDRPQATFSQVVAATAMARDASYTWLIQGRNAAARQRAIRVMLEQEAFAEIHAGWRRVGYPFESMVPSLASALGAAADRPAALAELMGIIVAGGVRHPVGRIERLHFARGTPYETVVACRARRAERVMAPEVAAALRGALTEVVDKGTAARVRGLFANAGDATLKIGGKTGTGDHRHKVFAPGGVLREARVVNRAATFVFFAGDRLYGTVTAYVPGAQAAHYEFTSALPVQVLKVLEPALRRLATPPPPLQDASRQRQHTAAGVALAVPAIDAVK